MRRMIRVLLVFALMAIFATAAYAFTASNTVNDSYAGTGPGAIKGYQVTNVQYSLANDGRLATVSFMLSQPEAHSVAVKFTGTGASGTTYTGTNKPNSAPCSENSDVWQCTIDEPATVTGIQVTAAQ